jgi:polysaccharide export outer membrane protein
MRSTTILVRIMAFVACVLLAACASGPALVSTNPNVRVTTSALPTPGPNENLTPPDDYRIGPLDLLTITVFGVTDLTQDVRVDALGNITLPLIGQVQAGGRTTTGLQDEIAKKLRNGFLQNPQISVFIKEFDSQRVTVEGVVKKPGVFPLAGPSSLLRVIATAQGLDELADHKGVVIFRTIKGQKMAAVYDIDAIGRGAVDDPPVYSNDVVVVALSKSKDRLRNFIQASPVLDIFRLY